MGARRDGVRGQWRDNNGALMNEGENWRAKPRVRVEVRIVPSFGAALGEGRGDGPRAHHGGSSSDLGGPSSVARRRHDGEASRGRGAEGGRTRTAQARDGSAVAGRRGHRGNEPGAGRCNLRHCRKANNDACRALQSDDGIHLVLQAASNRKGKTLVGRLEQIAPIKLRCV